MNRINLTKYGFTRFPEEDFSDDGNRFTCYRFSDTNSHVSKLVSDGQAYLSCHVEGQLPYETYSQLPNYRAATWSYNGISVSSLTDEMLKDFFRACVQYEKEYQAAEAAIVYPTLEEIKEKAGKITFKLLSEVIQVETLIKNYAFEALVKFSSYDWKYIQEYTQKLLAEARRFDPDTFPQTIVGKSSSFNFVEPNTHMGQSFYFREIKEIFEKYDIKA